MSSIRKKVIKIGNSIAIVIPAPLAKAMGVRAGSRVTIEVRGRSIWITPVRGAQNKRRVI